MAVLLLSGALPAQDIGCLCAIAEMRNPYLLLT